MKLSRSVPAVLLALLLTVCALPQGVFALPAQTAQTREEVAPPLPRGFSFSGVTKTDPDGNTLFYAENQASESGLVMGLWFDGSGKEVLQAETLVTPGGGTRKRAAENLPAAYDARDDGLLTPVKLQTGNTCWAFASVACMEADAIKNGLATADSIDLSEAHLVWFGRNAYFTGETDPRNDGLSASDAEEAVNKGGNASYVENAMNNFMGPANESDYPVDMTNAQTLPAALQSTFAFSDRFNRAYDFAGVRRIVSDEANIKKAVLTYGAAEQYFFTDNAYFTNRWPADDAERAIPATYYYPNDVETKKINHAVAIVGWDDSFSRENFTGTAKPEHDGAWLCRNSWSTAFGNDGYFWMSYENHGCYGAVNVYEIAEKDTSVFTQFYDGYGSHSAESATDAANIFTASGEVSLRAVSLGTALNDYSFSVYTGLSATSYPTMGQCVYTQSGNGGGKTVIGLEGKVTLHAGERYAVLFSGLTEVPVEGASFDEQDGNRYRFTSGRYQSFLKTGGAWTDCSTFGKNNVCIRAFEKAQSGPPYTVTFACTAGGFETAAVTETNTVALPEAPEGYAYSFTCSGSSFDGTNVTQDVTVRTHCYPVSGVPSSDDPCLLEYRCKFCGADVLPSVKQHTLESTQVSPSATSPGYTQLSCVYGDDWKITDVVLKDGAVGGTIGDALAWQLFDGILSVAGTGALPDYTASNPAPWNNDTLRPQIKRFIAGEGITALGSLALSELSQLEEITLPASLETVTDTSFGKGSLTALKKVNVAEGNTAFQSENGVLKSADGTVLYLYPANMPGAVYQVPDTVTVFAPYCFAGNQNIEYLDLFLSKPSVLPGYFCSYAAKLRHVNLPYQTHSVRAGAFYDPDGLITDIFIRNNVTMPNGDVFGYNPKIYIDSSSSSARNYAVNYNNSNYVLLSNHSHNYSAGTEVFEAVCDVPAYTVNLCVCGNFSVTKGTAPGHSFGDWEVYNDAEHRRVCTNDATHIETAFHTWNSGTVTTNPTCTEAGVKTYTCTVCGGTKTENLDPLNHNFGAWTSISETEHRRVCANDATHVETAAHTWNSGAVTAKPTCTADGVKTYTCTVCGGTKTETLDPLNHSYGAWTSISETEHRRVCANDATHTETAAHTWNSGTVTAKPTCTADGVKTYTCTVCGGTKTARISALGHTSPNGSGDCERCGTHIKDVVDPNACPYCGENHSGVFGWLVKLILTLIFRLFGKK